VPPPDRSIHTNMPDLARVLAVSRAHSLAVLAGALLAPQVALLHYRAAVRWPVAGHSALQVPRKAERGVLPRGGPLAMGGAARSL